MMRSSQPQYLGDKAYECALSDLTVPKFILNENVAPAAAIDVFWNKFCDS